MDIRDLLAGLGQNTQAKGAGRPDNLLSGGAGEFAGFFKRIEEEKLEKLREKILEEMGLTEEALSKMSPERRAEVETAVAKEIQRRMALTSLEAEDENNSAKKLPASGATGMMGMAFLLPRQKLMEQES